jgi:hypothetical protein
MNWALYHREFQKQFSSKKFWVFHNKVKIACIEFYVCENSALCVMKNLTLIKIIYELIMSRVMLLITIEKVNKHKHELKIDMQSVELAMALR